MDVSLSGAVLPELNLEVHLKGKLWVCLEVYTLGEPSGEGWGPYRWVSLFVVLRPMLTKAGPFQRCAIKRASLGKPYGVP